MEMELQIFNTKEDEEGGDVIVNRQTNGERENSLKTKQKWLYTVAVFGFYYAKGAKLAAIMFYYAYSFDYSYHTTGIIYDDFFNIRAIAYIVGCVLSPFGFSRFPCEPQLAVVTAVLALATMIMSAFSMQFYVMLVLTIISQLAEGYLESGIQPYVAHIWRGTKHSAPVMQANGLILCISCILSIVMFNSFYVDEQLISICFKFDEAENFTVYNIHFTTTPTTASMNINSNSALSMESDDVTHSSVDCSKLITNVSKSFLVVGLLYLLIPGFIWCVGSILAIVSESPQTSCNSISSFQPGSRPNSEYQQNKSRRLHCILFIGMLTVLVVLHASIFLPFIYSIISQLMIRPMAYNERSYFVDKILVCLSQTVALATSAVVSSSKIIACCLLLSILGAVIVTFSVSVYSKLLMYIGSLIFEFGLAPVIPACYTWTNEVTGLSPTHSAVITVGAMFGDIISSRLAEPQVLFEYMFLRYIIISCWVFQFLIMVFLLFYVERQLKKRRIA